MTRLVTLDKENTPNQVISKITDKNAKKQIRKIQGGINCS